MKEGNELLICECHSTDHQIVFLYSSDNIDGVEYPMCYAHVHLAKKPFFDRLKYGIRYIFGYQCRYGAFDEFIFNPDDLHKLESIVEHLKNVK
jgi:hypothetical protein